MIYTSKLNRIPINTTQALNPLQNNSQCPLLYRPFLTLHQRTSIPIISPLTLVNSYFPRCLLFHSQNLRTSSLASNFSTVFNSRASVLLSYIEWIALRSEERRVGKECRYRWSQY